MLKMFFVKEKLRRNRALVGLLVACHQIGYTSILSFVVKADINCWVPINVMFSSLVDGGSIRGPVVVIFSLDFCRFSVDMVFFLLIVGVRTHDHLSFFVQVKY